MINSKHSAQHLAAALHHYQQQRMRKWKRSLQVERVRQLAKAQEKDLYLPQAQVAAQANFLWSHF